MDRSPMHNPCPRSPRQRADESENAKPPMTSPNCQTAREMVVQLRAKKLSARELLEAHLSRHGQLAKTVNAVIATDPERAYRDADAIDNKRVRGQELGSLAGLPLTIKDGFD